jgi:Pyruvate/2-oxoacid:ferredoxin oxidoreductase delta subunit
MVVRKIIKIDEKKCDGCGKCVSACAEGAIAMVKGKAKLVHETYCDGLGACIGDCPQGAITMESREAPSFTEETMSKHLQKSAKATHKPATVVEGGFVCPGTMAKRIREQKVEAASPQVTAQSHLTHWPIQLKLMSPNAPYLKNADLLLAGDCVPFALGDFHNKILKGCSVLIGCPKLDDAKYYIEKLAQILKAAMPKSLTVVHMEVPCCFGLRHIAEAAIELSGLNLAIKDITIGLDGKIM